MIETTSIEYGRTGKSTNTNELGMRPMQERAWEQRGEQFLLIKSPPASGKSRAVMYITLDKLHTQGLRKAIITVPEAVIGASFASEPLTKTGFTEDWVVDPKWDLCSTDAVDDGKVNSVGKFLDSDDAKDRVLLCAHATFRIAFEKYGVARFDDCVIALDEVHHASADTGANVLGKRVSGLIDRGKAHVVAMTGTFFRGDAVPVFSSADEDKFKTVVYTGYEQLDGYKYLKSLRIDHTFYAGNYPDIIMDVIDPKKKTIIYIPNVNAADATDKLQDVDRVISKIGKQLGRDKETGFRLVKCAKTNDILKIADLVDDNPERRTRVVAALRDRSQRDNREFVDIVIALNMAKEGFDWIWAEHAIAIGYRASLTEVVQIMGRVTRDACGKHVARFTNMIRDPAADQTELMEAVNDRLKAISMGLLMEQVYAPAFKMTPVASVPIETKDDNNDNDASDKEQRNAEPDPKTGLIKVDVRGLTEIENPETRKKIDRVMPDLLRRIFQHPKAREATLVILPDSKAGGDHTDHAEYIAQRDGGNIIREAIASECPELDTDGVAEVEPHVRAQIAARERARAEREGRSAPDEDRGKQPTRDKIVTDRKRLALEVSELDIDLIKKFDIFSNARRILGKDVDAGNLRQVKDAIDRKRAGEPMTYEEADRLTKKAVDWKKDRGVFPDIKSSDSWERKLAFAMEELYRMDKERG